MNTSKIASEILKKAALISSEKQIPNIGDVVVETKRVLEACWVKFKSGKEIAFHTDVDIGDKEVVKK